MQPVTPPKPQAAAWAGLDYAPRFAAWFAALDARHTQQLSFAEIRRALSALSDLYVHKRHKLAGGQVFVGRGKRAAFALYYAPLHFLLMAHIIQAQAPKVHGTLVDLGCGTGAAALAWAEATGGVKTLTGYDCNGWAVAEANWNWRHMGWAGRAHKANATPERLAHLGPGDGVVAAFVINEMPEAMRRAMLAGLLAAHARGVVVLVVEPIAKTVTDFWPEWEAAFVAAGGVAQTWRIPARLPAELRLLDKATGLRHDVLKGRSLYLPGLTTRHAL